MAVEPDAREVPPISALTMRFFQRVVRGYFRRHFRAVMVQQAERLVEVEGPLIVYANHSSWWDPMISLLLTKTLLPERKHYGPMDAAALARYPILRKLGVFPVEMGSARGAAEFLRTSQAILAAGGVIWITPQGRFVDPREAVLGFKAGLGALAVRSKGVTLLPLAIEYTFWDERLPEALVRFGSPVRIDSEESGEVARLRLEAGLADAMEELKVASMARDAGAFRVLLRGGRGAGGFYGVGRRLRAWVSGKPLGLDHTERRELPGAEEKP